MKVFAWKRALTLLTVAAFLSSGCASVQHVPLNHAAQGSAQPNVKPGETVVVTKKDGAKQKFTVTAVENEALVGDGVRVAYDEMASLDVQRGDGSHGSRTTMIVVGVLLGAAAIAAASSGGGGGGY